jgi:hypothetical protein
MDQLAGALGALLSILLLGWALAILMRRLPGRRSRPAAPATPVATTMKPQMPLPTLATLAPANIEAAGGRFADADMRGIERLLERIENTLSGSLFSDSPKDALNRIAGQLDRMTDILQDISRKLDR